MTPLTINVRGSGAVVDRVRRGLADRRQFHARLAVITKNFTQQHVLGLNQHATANRLGASPTNHLENAAKGISSISDDTTSTLLFPRASRLRAAFGEYKVTNQSGGTYVAVPASSRTYGKRPREISEKLKFVPFGGAGGRFKALVFPDGSIAYWLKREVTIPEDRTLLPFEQYPKLVTRIARGYVVELKTGNAGGDE